MSDDLIHDEIAQDNAENSRDAIFARIKEQEERHLEALQKAHWRMFLLTKVAVASQAYFDCAVQDEAEERECCVDGKQHELAKELRDALLDLKQRGQS